MGQAMLWLQKAFKSQWSNTMHGYFFLPVLNIHQGSMVGEGLLYVVLKDGPSTPGIIIPGKGTGK